MDLHKVIGRLADRQVVDMFDVSESIDDAEQAMIGDFRRILGIAATNANMNRELQSIAAYVKQTIVRPGDVNRWLTPDDHRLRDLIDKSGVSQDKMLVEVHVFQFISHIVHFKIQGVRI